MIGQLKLYAIGGLTIVVGILGFLLQNAKLKATTKELKTMKKTRQIERDVDKILANRNIVEVLDGVEKEIKNGDISSLDD